MGMGTRRRRQRQEQIWIAQQEVSKGPAHPFYARVNELLEEKKFDEFAEKECAKFYADNIGPLWRRESIFVCCCWAILKGSIRSEESLGGRRIH